MTEDRDDGNGQKAQLVSAGGEKKAAWVVYYADQQKLCHVWTAPSWQGKSLRYVAGRCRHVFGLLMRFT